MLPSSGPISADDLLLELGLPAKASVSLGQVDVRSLAGQATGPVDFNTLRGKTAYQGVTCTGTGSNRGGGSSSVVLDPAPPWVSPPPIWGTWITEDVQNGMWGLPNGVFFYISDAYPKTAFVSLEVVEWGKTYLSSAATFKNGVDGMMGYYTVWGWSNATRIVFNNNQTYHFIFR